MNALFDAPEAHWINQSRQSCAIHSGEFDAIAVRILVLEYFGANFSDGRRLSAGRQDSRKENAIPVA
jgi:hypothetical protein